MLFKMVLIFTGTNKVHKYTFPSSINFQLSILAPCQFFKIAVFLYLEGMNSFGYTRFPWV